MKERLSIVRNAAISSVGTYAEYALGLVTSVWIARALGPTEFGHYSFIVWLCGWMLIASNNALTMSSIKFLAEARGRGDIPGAQAIVAYLLRLQMFSSGGVIALFLIAMLVDQPDEWSGSSTWMIPMVAVAVATRAGFAMRAAIAKGFERFAPEAAAVITVGCLTVAMVFAATGRTHDFRVFFLIYMIGSVLLDVILRIGLRARNIVGKPGPIGDALLARLKKHLLSTGIMIVLLSMSTRTIETLLLKATATAAEVGFFAISATLAKGAVDVLASGLSATLLPAMARSFGRDSQLRSGMLGDSIRFFAFLGFGLACGGFLVTPAIVHLMYGLRFEQAIPATQISLLIAGCSLLAAPINAFQTTSDFQADRIRIAAITLAVNLIAGILLVPQWGLFGALATYGIARTAYIAAAIGFLQLRAPGHFPVRTTLLMLGASVISGLLAAAASQPFAGMAAAVVGGMSFTILYLATSILIRCWYSADYLLAEKLMQRIKAPRSLRQLVLTAERHCSAREASSPG
jgi:O-antigen/teichoic acid export membrane protein